MFTTQHYQVLAEVFNKQLRELWNNREPDGIQVYTLMKTAEDLANVLQSDNANFDFAYFMSVVGLHTGYHYSREAMNSWYRSYQGGMRKLNAGIDESLREMVKETDPALHYSSQLRVSSGDYSA